MKQSLIIICSILLLFSCSEPNKELVITFESAAGLEEGDDVIMKEQTIGEVTKIELNGDYKTDVHIYLDKVDRLPKDSRFVIGVGGLFSDAIYIVPGNAKSYLTSRDKIIGSESKELQMDSLVNKFIDKIPEPEHKEDSVLKELRDIKHEIHEVNEKTE